MIASNLVEGLLFTLFMVVCILVVVIVLLQKGRGGGLGAAFGGVASSAFGTRVGDVMTWVTIVLVGLFLLLAVGLTVYFRPERQQARPPILQPTPPGTGSGTQTVTMYSDNPPDARIYYTLDGSDPDEESTLYEGAVSVPEGTTIKTIAYFAGTDPSRIVAGYYGAVAEIETPQSTLPPVESIETPQPTLSPAESIETPSEANEPAAAPITVPAQ